MALQATEALPTTQLGTSGMEVTKVCLGTMTFGMQNSEEDAHAQLDYAIKDRGVNFIDTAEIYPVPSSAPGWVPGVTETFVGTWLAKNKDIRHKIVVATKVMGFLPKSDSVGNRYDPKGPCADARLDAKSVKDACAGSLRRLQTEYIDLYQLHWPDRYVPSFGRSYYDPESIRPNPVPIRETLQALGDLIKDGKIRHYGLSNETAFGVCEWVRAADELGLPRPVSIQNEFNLVSRSFEEGILEACAPNNYNIGLLPWSPLAGGILSGKYLPNSGDDTSKARFGMFKQYQSRFMSARTINATERYHAVAASINMSLAALALAWCNQRYYVGSTIIGATSLKQLEENINAFTVELPKDVMSAIDEIHLECRNPCSIL